MSGRARRVALTFDAEHPDRPRTPGSETALLDALRAAGVAASFFVQGRWAEAEPAVARRIADDGHLVGSHSHYHARLPLLTDAGLRADLGDAHVAILEATGMDPRPWFRCPFGAGMDDARVLTAIDEAGYRHVGWDLDVEDWRPELTAPDIERIVVDGVSQHDDGAVVLLHAWPDGTAAALPAIIRRLGEAGWSFVRLDGLDGVPAGAPGFAVDDDAPGGAARSAASRTMSG